MHTTRKTEKTPAHETIRSLAYCLWEEAGRPPDQDLFFWTEAENRLAASKAPGRTVDAPRAKTAAREPNGSASSARNGRPPKTAARKTTR